MRAALDAELEAERAVQRLEHALHDLVAARDDSGDTPVLVGQLLAGREVHACDLEERDVVGAGVDARAAPPRRARGRSSSAGSPDPTSSDSAAGWRPALGSVATRLHVYASERPAPTSVSSTTRRRRCSFVSRPRTWRRSGMVSGMRSRSGRATSSIRSTSRVTSRARHVGTVTSQSSETSKPNPRSVERCSSGGHVEADHARRALRAQVNDRTLGEPGMHVGMTRHPRTGEIDEHPAGQNGRVLGEVRVDPLLPAIRPGGAQRKSLRRAQDAERLEVRRFEEHLGRVVGDLAVRAAHDRGQRDRLLAVRDEEIVGLESPQSPVERAQLLAGVRATNDDASTGELRPVEGVQRAAPDVHHVVRHVDDVGDRPHLGEEEPRPQPLRRRADRDVAKDAADVARAAAEVLDRDVDLLGIDDRRIVGLGRMELPAERALRSRARPRPSRAGRRGSPSA